MVIASAIYEISCTIPIGHPLKQLPPACAPLNILPDGLVESGINRLQFSVNGLRPVMKCCSDGLPIREAGIKGVEGLETLTQMPRFVQRTILFQLPNEAHQRILDRHSVTA